MWKRLLIALILITLLIPTSVAHAKKPFRLTTDYVFVGHLGTFDSEGRLLGWQGTVSGDIEGTIKWWMEVPFRETGQVSHFVDRWEIWDSSGTVLILAGEEEGSTTDRPGQNGVWRANGTVTYVNPDYPDLQEWLDRPMHEEGEFVWLIPGLLPDYGWGTFRIN